MIGKFIEENLAITESFVKMPAAEIYDRYLMFCEVNDLKALSKRKFNEQLVSNGLTKGRGAQNVLVFSGVFLKRCKY